MRECEAASEEAGRENRKSFFKNTHTHSHPSTSGIYEAAARNDFRQRPWREIKNSTKEERR